MTYFFRFESKEERTLAYIPMMVRMKLDVSGVKLSLAQWNQLPESDRRRLFELPCENLPQARTYRTLLCDLVLQYAGAPPRLLDFPIDPAWNNVDEVPAQLIHRAQDLGLASPSLDRWRALSSAQRFALLKLSREGHVSPHYLPALQEFALI